MGDIVAGRSRYTTFRYRHSDDRWHWLEAWGTQVLYRGRCHVLSVSRDITERRRAEDDLRESGALHRFLAENTSDILTLYDQEANRLYISPSYAKVLGWLPERAFDGVHPDDLQAGHEVWQRLSRGEQTYVTFRHRHADGSWRWLEASATRAAYRGQPALMAVTVTSLHSGRSAWGIWSQAGTSICG